MRCTNCSRPCTTCDDCGNETHCPYCLTCALHLPRGVAQTNARDGWFAKIDLDEDAFRALDAATRAPSELHVRLALNEVVRCSGPALHEYRERQKLERRRRGS